MVILRVRYEIQVQVALKKRKLKKNKQEEAPDTPSNSFFLKKKLYKIHFKSIFT